MSAQTAYDAYFAIVRALKVGNQMTWAMAGQLSALRKQLGVSEEQHQRILAEVSSDPAVEAWGNYTGAKQGAGTPHAAAAPQAYGSAPMSAPPPRSKQAKAQVRRSDPGMGARPAGSKPVVFDDGFNLVGWNIAITQEDESVAYAVVTGYNAATRCHICTSNYGTLEAADTELPLADNPDAYERINEHPDFYPPPSLVPPVAMAQPQGGYSAPALPKSQPRGPRPPLVRMGSMSGKLSGPPYPAGGLAAKLADPSTSVEQIAQMLEAVCRKEQQLVDQLAAEGVDLEAEFLASQQQRASLARELLEGLC